MIRKITMIILWIAWIIGISYGIRITHQEILNKTWQDGYNRGYKEYLMKTYVPDEDYIPHKSPNPDLKEKFQG